MSLLKPLNLRGIDFKSGLIQGPLAGYSCAAFRRLIWQYSNPAFCYTEMLPAGKICQESGKINRYTWRHADEKNLCYQLSGNDPVLLSEACAIVSDMGADCVDLNAGCPKPTIRKKGHGSALLSKPENLYQCLSAMRAQLSCPLLLKIRIDGKSTDRLNQKVCDAAVQAGADALVVHARHWTDPYEQACQWDQVSQIQSNSPIPVIINGDLNTPALLDNALHKTGCVHAMVSRGSMGRPNLIDDLNKRTKCCEISLHHSRQWLMQHLKGLLKFETESVVHLKARGIAHYYAKHLSQSDANRLIHAVYASGALKEIFIILGDG